MLNRAGYAARIVLMLIGVGVCTPVAADAQPYDHQTCFKVKDAQKFSALVDLAIATTKFEPPSECKVIGKAKYYCTPTQKTVNEFLVDGAPGTLLPVEGYTPVSDRVCYKVKCAKAVIAPELISDQFGSRDLSKFKAQLLCTPAIQGPPPTCGDGIVDVGEVCDDGNVLDGDCCDSTCSSSAANGTPCNDGDACTTPDQCTAGTCVGTILSDAYEPNDTVATAAYLGVVDDDDSFPSIGIAPRLYPASDDTDVFSYEINDVPFGAFDPRANLTLNGGEDYEMSFSYACTAGTTSFTCAAPSVACTLPGSAVAACCRSGSGSIQFASIDCIGSTDDSGLATVAVTRESGAATCTTYLLQLGDD